MSMTLGFDMRTKVPWTMVIVAAISLVIFIYLFLVLFGYIEPDSILLWVTTFFFTATFLVVFAIIGGIFVGMIVATRSLSTKGLTPFEASMLQMHQDVKQLTNEVRALRNEVEEFHTTEVEEKALSEGDSINEDI